ncbi:MAG: NAD-dependent epimerase/dehydratase family protein, partial [Candidatus Cloacimonetes bacterium]|nr:NAD-dependent epimerase/dehydratase family protein [Candidatus Cloacimonadota bacterium]
MKKTVLLTGATGYVGKYVLRELIRKGYKVKCLIKKDSFIDIDNSLIHVYIGDILDKNSLDHVTNGVDYV